VRPVRAVMRAHWLVVAALLGAMLPSLLHPLPIRSVEPASLPPLSVAGNQLLAGGQPIQLRGVNRSGTEYACVQGWGIFDGPADAASVAAMVAWHVNAVRLPLNEDCWLGLNGVPSQFSGASYQQAIRDYVDLLHEDGLYAELSLHSSAPGTTAATGLSPILDADHGLDFWRSVASAFKDDPAVFFGLESEPFGVDFNCWLNGGDACAGQVSYVAAGMQEALETVRSTGAGNVVAISGLRWANDLTGWLANMPADPLSPPQVVAEAHVYGNNECGGKDGGACLEATIGPVTQVVPVVFGETGEAYDEAECSADAMKVILPWADAHRVSYLAWTWSAWGDCQSLMSGRGEYATYVQEHLAAVAAA
jgi:endoglucanase